MQVYHKIISLACMVGLKVGIRILLIALHYGIILKMLKIKIRIGRSNRALGPMPILVTLPLTQKWENVSTVTPRIYNVRCILVKEARYIFL